MATTNAYVSYADTAVRGTWHTITRVWRDTAHATPENTPAGSTVYESSKDVIGNVVTAVEGWYIDTSNGTVTADIPADTSVGAQRAEIEGIVRQSYNEFDFDRWGLVDTSSRPIKQMILKWLRMIIAYANASTSNNQLDECKTESRRPLAELAEYADASAWNTGLDSAGFRVWQKPEPAVTDSAPLPPPLAGMPTLTAQQITATDMAAVLA